MVAKNVVFLAAPLGEPSLLLPPLGVVLHAALAAPLGEVPRSGKGGVVGNFGLVPFIGRHPLSLALLDSSPTGEPRPLLPPLGEVPR